MSVKVLERLSAEFGDKILESSTFRGDDRARVAPGDWLAVAKFLRDDPECAMNQLVDITAVDYPERDATSGRFDVILLVRSLSLGHRVVLKTHLRDGQELDSLVPVWKGADWTEREVFDMFGIRFKGHPDLRRILMYEEFEGYPLRKDYPIGRTQPLVPYRDVPSAKLAPFGPAMGQPYARIDWLARLGGHNRQVSPAIAVQQEQRPALSATTADGAQGATGSSED